MPKKAKTLTEAEALKQLNAENFEQMDMTDERAKAMPEILSQMDPDDAKQVLSVIPNFATAIPKVIDELRLTINDMLNKNDSSQNQFYAACNQILDSLQDERKNKKLSPEEKGHIIDKMIEVAKMMSEKDSESKKMSLATFNIFSWIIGILAGLVVGVLAFFGIKNGDWPIGGGNTHNL